MVGMRESTVLLLSALFVLLSYIFSRARKSRGPYPPGPPPVPVIGNILDIPTQKPWVKYLELSKQLNSECNHLRTAIASQLNFQFRHRHTLNTHIIILNSLEDVMEVMERRSTNYSNRPAMPIFELYVHDLFDALRLMQRLIFLG